LVEPKSKQTILAEKDEKLVNILQGRREVSHGAVWHLGKKTRNNRNLGVSHPPTVWQGLSKLITCGYREPTNGVFNMSQPRRAQLLMTEMIFGFPMDAVKTSPIQQ